jgi:hypothetical protein
LTARLAHEASSLIGDIRKEVYDGYSKPSFNPSGFEINFRSEGTKNKTKVTKGIFLERWGSPPET